MKDMTHSDLSVRLGSDELVSHGALRRTRRLSLEVTRIDWLCFIPFNFKSFDDHCSRLAASIVQLFGADNVDLNISIRNRP
jgi:hypothetical protein